jgi:hypothetical protein
LACTTVAVPGALSPPLNTHAPASRISSCSAPTLRMISSSCSGGGGSLSGV